MRSGDALVCLAVSDAASARIIASEGQMRSAAFLHSDRSSH